MQPQSRAWYYLMSLVQLAVLIAILVFMIIFAINVGYLKNIYHVMKDIRTILEGLAPCVQMICMPPV